MPNPKIAPCLWFDNRIEEAVNFYVSVFGGEITDRSFYPEGGPQPAGTPLTMSFTIAGQHVTALNGGPAVQFNEAISFFVNCADQAEIDRYWDLLTADGGQEIQCGWLKDKYGLSWQIASDAIMTLWRGDPAKAGRAMQAMMGMKKLDIAALERAYEQG